MAFGFVNAKAFSALEGARKRHGLADMVTKIFESLQLVLVLATFNNALHHLVIHHALRETSGRGEPFCASALRAIAPKSQLVIKTALAYDGKAVVLAHEGRPRSLQADEASEVFRLVSRLTNEASADFVSFFFEVFSKLSSLVVRYNK